MGITGLHPFLKNSSRKCNVKEFSGGVVAIDAYCWLHKSIFSCSEKLAMGQKTDAYVTYCMKFVRMLQYHKIKPILVFDGQNLPAKAETEAKRRELRKLNRKKAAELLRIGQTAEGHSLLRKSIDVTHEMALELIKCCQNESIDCIVAPYEADSQLAYLNIIKIADVIITEDSDLTLFGCSKILFKMDVSGNGILVEREKLYLSMGMQENQFDFEKFRHMCILSGCDYLQSLPGIGLAKARKFVLRNTDNDIHKALTQLGSYLNMKSLIVTPEYCDAFIRALITFKHQLVFCPIKRKQVRLTPVTPDVTEEQLYYAGIESDPDIAFQLALGNVDPLSLKKLHNFNPDNTQENQQKNKVNSNSIWGKYCRIKKNTDSDESKHKTFFSIFKKKVVCDSSQSVQNSVSSNTVDELNKKLLEQQQSAEREILALYSDQSIESNKEVLKENTSPVKDNISNISKLHDNTNLFMDQSTVSNTSPILASRKRSRLNVRNMRFKRIALDESILVESKFFTKSKSVNDDSLASEVSDENSLYTDEKENSLSDSLLVNIDSLNLSNSILNEDESQHEITLNEENSDNIRINKRKASDNIVEHVQERLRRKIDEKLEKNRILDKSTKRKISDVLIPFKRVKDNVDNKRKQNVKVIIPETYIEMEETCNMTKHCEENLEKDFNNYTIVPETCISDEENVKTNLDVSCIIPESCLETDSYDDNILKLHTNVKKEIIMETIEDETFRSKAVAEKFIKVIPETCLDTTPNEECSSLNCNIGLNDSVIINSLDSESGVSHSEDLTPTSTKSDEQLENFRLHDILKPQYHDDSDFLISLNCSNGTEVIPWTSVKKESTFNKTKKVPVRVTQNRTTKKSRAKKLQTPLQSQQSKLSMFGFQKRQSSKLE